MKEKTFKKVKQTIIYKRIGQWDIDLQISLVYGHVVSGQSHFHKLVEK